MITLRQALIEERVGTLHNLGANGALLNQAIRRYVHDHHVLMRGPLVAALQELHCDPPTTIAAYCSGVYRPTTRFLDGNEFAQYAIPSRNKHILKIEGITVNTLAECLMKLCGRPMRVSNGKELHAGRDKRYRRHSIARDVVWYDDEQVMLDHIRPQFALDLERHIARVTDRFVE